MGCNLIRYGVNNSTILDETRMMTTFSIIAVAIAQLNKQAKQNVINMVRDPGVNKVLRSYE